MPYACWMGDQSLLSGSGYNRMGSGGSTEGVSATERDCGRLPRAPSSKNVPIAGAPDWENPTGLGAGRLRTYKRLEWNERLLRVRHTRSTFFVALDPATFDTARGPGLSGLGRLAFAIEVVPCGVVLNGLCQSGIAALGSPSVFGAVSLKRPDEPSICTRENAPSTLRSRGRSISPYRHRKVPDAVATGLAIA